jgi:zinc protease
VAILDRPQGAQTELRLGHPGVPRAHPEFIALTVMNAILGGKFTSRINLNLRERHGFTYGAFSRFDGRRGPGPFAVRTAVETAAAGAAAREVIGELTRIRESPVEVEELDDARAWLIGTFPLSLQTTTGLADRLETLAVYGLPDDYYDRFPDAVLAVGRDDVLAVARRFLRPDELAVVAVGPAAELEPQLAGLGPLEVHPAPDAP